MPSIRQIAAACGFSKSTVAAALRNDPVISQPTRDIVHKTAQELGYSTDARLSQLMAYMRKNKPRQAKCNLAWINFNPNPDYWNTFDYSQAYFLPAKEHAHNLGYNLDILSIHDPCYKKDRLDKLLSSRGIEGLVLADPHPIILDQIDWSRYTCVGLSDHSAELRINRICPHYHDGMVTVLEALHRLGYRRPGLYLDNASDWMSENAYSSSFVRMQQRLFADQVVPMPIDLDSLPPIGDWFRLHRPDVILCTAKDDFTHLVDSGIRIPQDVALVHLNTGPETPGWAGLNTFRNLQGIACVDTLIAQLHRAEMGLPSHPKSVMIRGDWQEGWTAPPVQT